MQKFRGFKCINILPYAVNTTELGRVTEFIEEESLIEYNLELHGETNLIPIYSSAELQATAFSPKEFI
ncbi:hypothetical protein CWI37_1546p0010 [Hamiltosporidium tvaerminnensis]|uniref:Uncharacterized protein n=1 Tax=Hamiltosporidium tvaerminnensis TaxID=1176355 RepID=A0A4Q9KVI2_9MICR|nr:hypothetical protein CWI37_1546p0010 [Hamiltosporidium tvaerminnensis]